MAARKSTCLGNITLTHLQSGVVEVGLNTHTKGRPYALFTLDELPWLADQIKAFSATLPKAKPVSDLDPEDIL